MKKSIIKVLLLMLFFGLIPVFDYVVYASDDEIKSGDYYYTLMDDGTVGICGYCGVDRDIVIPETLDGYDVSYSQF